jgi:DNA ligase-1
MKFDRFCDYLEKLENTSSKLKMASIIADMYREARPHEMKMISYMTLGNIGPESEHLTTDMAESMILTSIALASGKDAGKLKKDYKKMGDLGLLAESEVKGGKNPFKKYFSVKSPSVKDVYEGMRKLAEITGAGSQEKKQKTLAAILLSVGRKGRRYATRLAAGTMRMGVGDMTLIDGLSKAYKIPEEEIEAAYYKCSDIGHIAETTGKGGRKGLKSVRVSLNSPIMSMLAQRVNRIETIKEKMPAGISVEEKYDGERIQAHKKGRNVQLFSRRLTEITDQFPDVVKQVRKLKVKSVILDGEAVAYDFKNKKYMRFQKLMQRRRKYDIEEYAEKIPVKYSVFDILYDNGKQMLNKKYSERRKRLENVVKKMEYIAPAGRIITEKIEELEDFFNDCLERGLEGVLCKNPESVYQPGARKWSWIKWKKEYASELADTFDLVVVGAFRGRGKRSGTYGALLCAVYNKKKDVFQTFTKVGTGFTDKELSGMVKKLKPAESKMKPARVESEMKPDQWFEPSFVLEVAGAEITRSSVHTAARKEGKGLALRFPRFRRWREDKKAEQATTVKEIERMRGGK